MRESGRRYPGLFPRSPSSRPSTSPHARLTATTVTRGRLRTVRYALEWASRKAPQSSSSPHLGSRYRRRHRAPAPEARSERPLKRIGCVVRARANRNRSLDWPGEPWRDQWNAFALGGGLDMRVLETGEEWNPFAPGGRPGAKAMLVMDEIGLRCFPAKPGTDQALSHAIPAVAAADRHPRTHLTARAMIACLVASSFPKQAASRRAFCLIVPSGARERAHGCLRGGSNARQSTRQAGHIAALARIGTC